MIKIIQSTQKTTILWINVKIMYFQLPSFLLFLLIALFIVKISKPSFRIFALILLSIVFYSYWDVGYFFILIFYIVLGAVACHLLTLSKRYLSFLIVFSLLPLIFYKYTDFFLRSIGVSGMGIALPLGISFITFSLISMMVDFSRSSVKKINYSDVGLYISFFPHLIAGPILRTKEVVPQFKGIHVSWQNFVYNLPLFAVGMIKKVLIADPIGGYIAPVFNDPLSHGFWDLFIASLGFSIQIYCDFSAYSDMAIAIAGMFAVRFPENFRSPYLSFSLSEMWKRWHMTLSFWLRDYLFVPLVRYFGKGLVYLPILITMLVSGLWHGANWNFIIWGGLQGIIMVIDNYIGFGKFVKNNPHFKWFFIIVNFFVWSFLAILFRSDSASSAWDYYQSLLAFNVVDFSADNQSVLILVLITLCVHYYDNVDFIRKHAAKIPAFLSVPVFISIIVGCSMVAAQHPESFYYFDF